jgi:cell division protein FtsW
MAPPQLWRRAAPWLMAVTLLLLIAVLVPLIGTSVKGARRWLRLGGMSLQPSEFAKFTLPLLVCSLAADGRWRSHGALRSFVSPLLPIGATVLLVAAEPDLGTALFLGLTGGLSLYFSGWPLRRFVVGAGLVVPLAIGLVVLRPYQVARVHGFLRAWENFDAAPYQIRQSLTALGAGGLWGSGPGLGEQKLSYLPEGNTDFVLAVIGEELGLVGTLGVVLLWCGLFGVGLRLLSRLHVGGFAQALGLTLLTSLVLQAAINVAVVTALVPPKGISLPLISYGGSNLFASLLSIGLILSLSRSIGATTATAVHSPAAAPPPAR